MVTPLLSKIRENGGTLYTFSSATKDLARVFTNDSYTFKFSHFACLDIPDLNKLKLYGSKCPFPKVNFENDYNRLLAEHFQNYIMNFETAILNGEGDDDDYDDTVIRTPSERIFFNWLQKIGAIEFEYANRNENLYYEKCGEYSFDAYNLEHHSEYVSKRVVKYIGNIDAINSVEVNGDAYGEVYLHIPSSVGASHEVRFGTVSDNNYNTGYYSLGGNSENIIGRKSGNGELSISAFYDYDSTDDEGNEDGYINTYTGDAGYIIDFRDTFYYNNFIGYGDIMTMNELSNEDFEFNCILIYYDYSDVSTTETVTNLYGVLFLDNVTTTGTTSYIQRFPKHKTTNIIGGNSFGMKVDLKVDAYPTSNMTYYNGNSQIDEDGKDLINYFQLYTEAMNKLQDTIDIFDRQQGEISKLEKRVHELEVLFFGIDKLNDMYERVYTLETRLNSSGLANQEELTELISLVNGRVDSIMSGRVPFDYVKVKGGSGIKVTNNTNSIVLDLPSSTYSINDMYLADEDYNGVKVSDDIISQDNKLKVHFADESSKSIVYTELKEGTNLAILYVQGSNCTNDMHIYIDDTNINWKVGQVMKIKMKDFIDFDLSSLVIFTGKDGNNYRQRIKIDGDNIPYTPVIEIVCVNDNMYDTNGSFIYEITSLDNSGKSGGSNGGSTSGTQNEPISDSSIDNLINEIF